MGRAVSEVRAQRCIEFSCIRESMTPGGGGAAVSCRGKKEASRQAGQTYFVPEGVVLHASLSAADGDGRRMLAFSEAQEQRVWQGLQGRSCRMCVFG